MSEQYIAVPGPVMKGFPGGFRQEEYMEHEEENVSAAEETFSGEVKIANEVVASIAALAATEIQGVSSLSGGMTHDQIARHASKNLNKGVTVNVKDKKVTAELSLNIDFGSSVPEVTSNVRERVKNAIENMTGLEVTDVRITVAGINM